MTLAADVAPVAAHFHSRRRKLLAATGLLATVLALLAIASLGTGAVKIPAGRVI